MTKIILVSIWVLLSPVIYVLTTKDWYNKKTLKIVKLTL